jgi:myosin heavy subunit
VAFGAKIKLTVDRSSAAQSEFRSAIQSMVDSATSKSPIKVKNISFELDANKITSVISDIQKAFDRSAIEVKIQKIDANAALADLQKQIEATASNIKGSGGSGGGGGLLQVNADDIIDRKRIAAAASKATAAFNSALTATGNNFASKLVSDAEGALVAYYEAAHDTTEEKAAMLEASLKYSSALKEEASNLTKVKKAAKDVTSEQTRLNSIKSQLASTTKSSYGLSDSSAKSSVQSDTVALMKQWKTLSSNLATGQNIQNIKQEIDVLAKSANELQSKTTQLVNIQKATSGVTSEVSKLGTVWNQLNSIMKKSDLLSDGSSKSILQENANKLIQEWKTISETLATSGSSPELIQQINALASNANALKGESDQLAQIEKNAANAATELSRLNSLRGQINSIYTGADSFRSSEAATEIQAIAEQLRYDWQDISQYVANNPIDMGTSRGKVDALAQSVSALKERFEAVKTAESQMDNTSSIVGGLKDSLKSLSATEKDISNISDEETKNDLLKQRKQIYDDINKAMTQTKTYQSGDTSAENLRKSASATTLNAYLELVKQYNSALSSLKTENLPYADDRQKTILAECVSLQGQLNSKLSDSVVLSARESGELRNNVESLANKVAEQQQYVALSNEAATLSNKIYDYLANNPNVTNKMGTSFTSIIDSISGANITVDAVKNATKEFDNLRASAKLAGLEGQSMWQKFGNAGSILTTWISARKIITSIISLVKKMISNVTELDAAMTELKKVTDLTATSYANFFNTAVKVAKNVGATVSDTINATADFARLGYGIGDATQLAQAALIYKNVGDGINDVSEASESLISTMKAFGIAAEDSMEIVDRFNEVGRFCPVA